MSAQIALTAGYSTTVDEADVELVMRAGPWRAQRRPHTVYAVRNVRRGNGGRTSEHLHTFLMGELADHRDGDGLNNQRSNLRPASSAENARNARLRSDNKAGFKGVCREARRGAWRATIKVDRRQRHLGYFDSPEEAAKAYDVAAREAFGEFATLNYPRAGERAA